MEFLGVGPLELVLILVLALVLLGPRDMAKFGRDAGRFLNRMYRSPTWRTMNDASRELRNLPNRLAREAELDSVQRDLQQVGQGMQQEMEQAGQGLQQDAQSSGDGMQAWTPAPRAAPPNLLPGKAATVAAPDATPDPPAAPPASDSPFAEG